MKFKSLLFFVLSSMVATAQTSLYRVVKDSNRFALTSSGASLLAALPLKCIVQQYPNKTSHVTDSDSDQLNSAPKQLHPVFFGCFDWHSSVHGHWMLVKLLKTFPQLPEAADIRTLLNNSFTVENILTEVKYFNRPLTSGWERTYGWAWLLKLDQELAGWNDPDAWRWHQALQPLSAKIVALWMSFLPKQTYANRAGMHTNTAFGLVLALDYARNARLPAFEKMITNAARHLYENDQNAPASWEPDGSDFLSPALEEADLMAHVLPAKAFLNWFNHFISAAGLTHLTMIPVISDRTDLQIVHLDGLCFSRSWCMRNIAAALPAGDYRKKILQQASASNLKTALPNVVSGNYGGEHWLATFAVLALMP